MTGKVVCCTGIALFHSLDSDNDGNVSCSELLAGLTKEGLSETEIHALLHALDVNHDGGSWLHLSIMQSTQTNGRFKKGVISRDEWLSAWDRSAKAIQTAGEKGHTDVKSMASVLTMMMKRPGVTFQDVRRWRGIDAEDCLRTKDGPEFAWVDYKFNKAALRAAGSSIPCTEVWHRYFMHARAKKSAGSRHHTSTTVGCLGTCEGVWPKRRMEELEWERAYTREGHPFCVIQNAYMRPLMHR